MTTHDKAQRATVQIGPLSVDGFQMPDGSYRMSQAGAAEAVGLIRRNAFEFLRSKAAKQLLGEGFTGSIADENVGKPQRNAGRFLELKGIKALWGKGYTSAISAIKVEATGSRTAAPRGRSRTLATTRHRGFQRLMPRTAILKIYPEAMPESGQV
ncbi:hypothetical protein GFS31_44470 (plasmid) [Leptolyngbya sp. BL0902]|uniref:hypothetical protein n=1 Tax=Leptolyngbya sp. BL0902 TaxID=1115757 RepID=UPI0018E7BAA4|nr:hypothetical protein [Leptolyngbya sp. BL0902]QQE67734.1 hypothetical protein GFS31_44470 [Leptolyngbya sp. BL0902]